MRIVVVISSLVCFSSFCACQTINSVGCLSVEAASTLQPDALKTGDEAISLIPNMAASPASCTDNNSAQTDNTIDGPVYEFRFSVVPSNLAIPASVASSKSVPHGEIFGMFGSTLTAAPDITLQDELPISDLGGLVGGNVGKNTSYFASFEQSGFHNGNLLPFLPKMQQRTGSGVLPIEENPASLTAIAARIDRQFGTRDSAYLRFDRNDMRSYPLGRIQTTNASGLTTDFGVKQQTIAAGNSVTISPNTVNETNAQVIRSEMQLPPNAKTLGVQSALPTLRRDRVFEAADNIHRQMGSQSVRAGGDFLYNQMQIAFLEAGMGRNSGGSFFSQSDRSAGLYAVDEKNLQRNVQLTAGVRYDVQALKGFRTDTNNVAPELGIAWGPSSRTVIRGGLGVYYDQIPLPIIAGSANSAGVANIQNSGTFVNRTGWHPGAVADFTAAPPSLQNSYAEHGEISVEEQVGAKSMVTAESQFLRGVQLALPASHFNAAELCVSAAACQAGNTFSGQEIGTGASFSNQATSLAFTQNPVRWGNYKVAYTFATAAGQGLGDNFSSIGDRIRRASFTGGLHTSFDPGSDLWQHLTNGFMLTGTGDYTTRSEFTGINFMNFNGQLSKTFALGQRYHLAILAESFNMLQETNAAFAHSMAKIGTSAAAVFDTYQRVASFQSPNGNQFGLRLDF